MFYSPFALLRNSFFFAAILCLPVWCSAQLQVVTAVTAQQMVNELVGQGATVSNITLNCPTGAFGTFSNGNATNLGIGSGIILTTGGATTAIGPNNTGAASIDNFITQTVPNLTAIEPLANRDPCVLQFNLVPQCSTLVFNYVFGSEEYPEWVTQGFNDAFGFFLTGPNPQGGNYNNFNIARVPGTALPVSIDNVNAGVNAQYYVDNTNGATIQYDAFTVVLPVSVPVTPCQTYTLQLAIADAGDGIYDSGVFLATNSLNCNIGNLVATTVPANCNGQGGSATASVSGGTPPYVFNWSNGATGPTITGLAPGTYGVTVTDNFPCTQPISTSVVVGQPTPSVVSASNTGPYCPNTLIQLSSAIVSGPGIPTAYSWSNPAGQVFSNVAAPTLPNAQPALAGTYTVTVTFNNGCTATAQTVVAILGSQASLTGVPVICSGQSTVLTASGGGSYAWSNGSTSASITVGQPGVYGVTVTAPGGCTATAAQSVTVNTSPTISIAGPAGVCTGQTATLTASGAGTYAWSTGESTVSISPLNTGTFQVTGTDANGCTGSATANFAFFPVPQPTASNNSPFCAGADLTLVAGNVAGTVSFQWSGPGNFSALTASATVPSATVGASGTYSLTVTDGNGCTGTAATTATVNALPVAVIAPPTLLNCANPNLTLNAGASQGAATFAWSGPGILAGNNTATPTVDQPGTYSLTAATALGCTATANAAVGLDNTFPTLTLDNIAPEICNGQCNGSIALTASAATGPLTFAWSGGLPATEDQANLCAGIYSVTVTDVGNGCTASLNNLQITAPPVLSLDFLSATPVNCFGACNGALSLQAGGGTQPYSFAWSGGLPSTEDQANLCAGSYSVTLTDANGCTALQSNLAVGGPSALNFSLAAQTPISCAGGCDGALDVTASGGTAPYSFAWNAGLPATEDQSNLCAGSYAVTVTDANGCTAALGPFAINAPVPIALSFTAVSPACFGQCDGAVDLTVAGGTAPYAYLWCDGATTPDVNGLCAGNQCVTVTDANGCTASIPAIVISQPSQLGATATATDALCNGACDGTADLTANGGTPPYAFAWSNGASVEDPVGLCAGTYTATVTDANGCTATAQIIVGQPAALALGETHQDVTCNGLCNGSINVTAGGGTSPYVFAWSNGATVEDPTALCAGNYALTLTDAQACTAVLAVTISQPAPLAAAPANISNITCNGLCNGSIDQLVTGGTAPYTYLWSNGATTEDISGLCAGTYSATVTDAQGCTVVLPGVAITEPATLGIAPGSLVNVTCNGACNGAIATVAFGGISPYAYNWNFPFGNLPNPANICAGLYAVTLTDANGCTASVGGLSITEPPVLAIASIVSTDLLCNGSCIGTASVSATGGTPTYGYAWSSGASNAQLTNLCAALYGVTVTDQNNCTVSAQTTVNQPPALAATVVVTPVSCFGGSNGAIDLTVSGGTPAYAYTWSNQVVSEDLSGLSLGFYGLTVTDANGCILNSSAAVSEPSLLALSATVADVQCFSACNGSADLSPVGGTPPYAFQWSSGATVEDPTGLCAGPYAVTTTDANGCTATLSLVVNEPPALTMALTGINDASCSYSCDGDASALADGGTPFPFGYLYQWDNGQTAPSALNLCPGTYTVTATDANNCTSSISAVMGAPTLVQPIVVTTPLSCFGGSDGTATGSANGGTPGYLYLWSTGNVGPFQVGLSRGNIFLTVTDANGCTASTSSFVSSPNPLSGNPNFQDALCADLPNGVIALNPSGGTAPYFYQWSNGATTAAVVGIGAGDFYDVTLTDANGCDTAIVDLSVGEPLPLQALAAALAPTTCANGSDGSAEITGFGGTAPYSYEWADLSTANPNTALPAGLHTATLTDANGCSVSVSVSVDEPGPIFVRFVVADNRCFGQAEGMIVIDSVSGGNPPYAISLDGDTYFPNVTAGYAFDNLIAGPYTAYVEDIAGCGDTTDLTVAEPAEIIFSAGIDTAIQMGDSVRLQAFVLNPSPGMTYQWTPADSLSCDDCLDPVARPVTTTAYVFTWTDTSGCTNSDQVVVRVRPERRIFIPNAFTPNDDGLNDVFMVYGGTGVRRIRQFSIFDRWGELLFSQSDFPATDPSFGWPGTFKGRQMNPDAFVYFLEVEFVDGAVLQYKGDVALIR